MTEGFYFTENVYQAVIEIKQEVNQSWQKVELKQPVVEIAIIQRR